MVGVVVKTMTEHIKDAGVCQAGCKALILMTQNNSKYKENSFK